MVPFLLKSDFARWRAWQEGIRRDRGGGVGSFIEEAAEDNGCPKRRRSASNEGHAGLGFGNSRRNWE